MALLPCTNVFRTKRTSKRVLTIFGNYYEMSRKKYFRVTTIRFTTIYFDVVMSHLQLSTDFVKTDNVCVCYADSDYSADDQVYIFYGVRTNADFLVHNGFVYPDNEHDAVKIRLGVSRSDPLYSLRYRLLQTLSLPALAEFYLTPGPFPVDGKLLAFVRIFNMDQSTNRVQCNTITHARIL